jgi:ribose transport system substrate-binding protein
MLCLCAESCGFHPTPTIAVIPQTEGWLIWDSVLVGANAAAKGRNVSIYWNAPTREDDVEAQIALVDQVVDRRYRGLVLAPDQALSLITPVRRVLAKGIFTVIIGSPLPISACANLSNVVNDDEAGGRLAAERVGVLLHGRGSVAVLGLNPDVAGIMIRARAFEQWLAQHNPDVHIVEKRAGSFNVPHERQVAEDVLKAHPDLDVIVALMWTTADGALTSLDLNRAHRSTRVIGFGSSGIPPFAQRAKLDSVIQEDTRAMGQKAIELIDAQLHKQHVPAFIALAPRLITRENLNSPEIRQMLPAGWQIGNWRWSPIQ